MADAPTRRGRSWMRLVGGSASPDLRHEFSTRGLAAVGLLDNSTPSSPSFVDRAAPLRPNPTMVGDVARAGGVSRRGRRWRQSIAPEASPPVRSPALSTWGNHRDGARVEYLKSTTSPFDDIFSSLLNRKRCRMFGEKATWRKEDLDGCEEDSSQLAYRTIVLHIVFYA
ncbi:hypothetical protein EJB05_15865 [Eragrostis curvula]|uniref:Uncharacterized protein n=1 Tax=Eragrostis curvula TaxID=38414 RepID=A0A5J9VF23_9POAL|nr:hypothetical protein EJB05_15865 [Eragrostis curvula]